MISWLLRHLNWLEYAVNIGLVVALGMFVWIFYHLLTGDKTGYRNCVKTCHPYIVSNLTTNERCICDMTKEVREIK